MKRYKAAQAALQAATRSGDDEGRRGRARTSSTRSSCSSATWARIVRLYTFLSQIFDYGNTAIEKRAIFYKRLLPLLEFGREREAIDLSKVKLTHHTLKEHGKAADAARRGRDAEARAARRRRAAAACRRRSGRGSREIIEKVNDLFEGELTDQDKLVYVNNVIKGKLLESETLAQQAANNTKEQFANSPDLDSELHERHHGCARRAHDDEHAGAELRAGAGGAEGHPVELRGAVGGVAGEGGVGQGELLPLGWQPRTTHCSMLGLQRLGRQ